MAVPAAWLVASRAVPAIAGPHIRALADAHRVRRVRRDPAGGGPGPLRALGGARAVRSAATVLPVAAPRANPPHDPVELARRAKAHAFALGFDLVGITELGPVQSAPLFEEWIAAGSAGTM